MLAVMGNCQHNKEMLPKLINTIVGMDYVTLKNLFLLHTFSSYNCIFRFYMSWMTNFASE
jgi:hypothetical protein